MPYSDFYDDILLDFQPVVLDLLDDSRANVQIDWTPSAVQQLAIINPAFNLGFGGQAGGGKSDLVIGCSLLYHKRSLVTRREYPQLKGIIDRSKELAAEFGTFNGQEKVLTLDNGRTVEYGSTPHPGDEERYQGRPHDFRAFDELPHFNFNQFNFMSGWVRSTDPTQRCRIITTFNPPTTDEGIWVKQFYGPWINPRHPVRAEAGEVLWFAMVNSQEHIVESGEPFYHDDELIIPQSRSFIPSSLRDNPYLDRTNYRSVLQSLPEPLRSQLLYGDFSIEPGSEAYQVIPGAWLRDAQDRWNARKDYPLPTLTAVGCDVARGGQDKTTIAPLYGHDFIGSVKKYLGKQTPDGPSVAALVALELRDNCNAIIDLGGVGSSPYDCLASQYPRTFGFNGASGSVKFDRSKRLKFANLRAEAYWRVREMLDPAYNPTLCIPDDPEVYADLTAARWSLTTQGILIESKDKIIKRLGRSPDCESIVYALHPATFSRKSIGSSFTGNISY